MTVAASRYLRPDDLRRLRRLLFSSRKVIDGRYAGRHASPRRGHSVEFNDYRPFIPGDSPADLDWKVLARTDRLYVRLSEHQSDMSVHLLIDASASMAYAGAPVIARPSPRMKSPPPRLWGRFLPWDSALRAARAQNSAARTVAPPPAAAAPLPTPPQATTSKFDHACRIAAAIAFLALQQQDQVSLGLARAGLATFLPAAGTLRHLHALLAAMEAAALHGAAGGAGLANAITALGARIGRRGVVLLLSDLLDPGPPILDALGRLAHRGHDVIVLHTLHPDEIALPDLDQALFIDSETGQRLRTDTPALRADYAQRFHRFQQGWASACQARGYDYRLVSTAVPYDRALESYLFTRAEG